MSDKWTLYHQTGPDGQEWGVKVRPGYVVIGFNREDAEAIIRWQNASCRPASDILERAKALCDNLYSGEANEAEQLRKEVERMRSTLANLKAHNYVNAFPDGGYAMRILQSYREMCDQYVSDNITGGPTNPIYIAMNEANEKRKIELDKAISNLAEIERLRSEHERLLKMIRNDDLPIRPCIADIFRQDDKNFVMECDTEAEALLQAYLAALEATE